MDGAILRPALRAFITNSRKTEKDGSHKLQGLGTWPKELRDTLLIRY